MCISPWGLRKSTEEIATWLDVYGIEERYQAKCCGESDGKYWIEQVLDEWQNDGKKPEDYFIHSGPADPNEALCRSQFSQAAFPRGVSEIWVIRHSKSIEKGR